MGAHLSGFAEAMASKDHVEGKLPHHWALHVDEAVGRLLQQQSRAQVRVLSTEEEGHHMALQRFVKPSLFTYSSQEE